MLFRMCSIGGRAYRGDGPTAERDSDEVKPLSMADTPLKDVVEVDLWASRQASSSRIHTDADNKEPDIEKFIDSTLLGDIQEAAKPNARPDVHATLLNDFFTVLSLCHTALAAVDSQTGAVRYKAQSPDESALVQAAADMGFVFMGKDKEILSLRTPRSADLEKYELLEILEFTSARKRMSVVLRRLDIDTDDLLLLTKGADNVIFERLRPGEEELKEETERHLNEFASNGLRTLTLAHKTVPGKSH